MQPKKRRLCGLFLGSARNGKIAVNLGIGGPSLWGTVAWNTIKAQAWAKNPYAD
jgi:hypothetical protein